MVGWPPIDWDWRLRVQQNACPVLRNAEGFGMDPGRTHGRLPAQRFLPFGKPHHASNLCWAGLQVMAPLRCWVPGMIL